MRDGVDLVSSTHLNGVKTDKESETDVEEGTVVNDSSNSAVRAFMEDENRRNAPLTAENSTRVMEVPLPSRRSL
ncbi:hypothetical protein LINPERHAP2_LOCUS41225 [Linum perenne]